MSIYLKNGENWKVASEESLDMHRKLPVGVYSVQFDPIQGFFLKKMPSFSFSGKRYGNNIQTTNRIIDTFNDRNHSTGVILVGEKGSGKTLLSKTVSMRAAEFGYPTILVNTSFGSILPQFNVLIQSIHESAVIIFDEFEKTFEEDDQNKILSLLDGVFNSKKLFIFTVNEKHLVSRFMFNRPGRIFYEIKFDQLSDEFVREYCADKLVNLNRLNEVITVSKTVWKFNFDMLQALVEEMNRYNESAFDSLKFLNISVDSMQVTLEVSELTSATERVAEILTKEVSVDLSSGKFSFNIHYNIHLSEDKKKEILASTNDLPPHERESVVNELMRTSSNRMVKFSVADVKVFDVANDHFAFESKEGLTLKMKRVYRSDFNIMSKLAF